ncbi:MAG: TVP38/TMEM64 family protein [wastewater metagenome]|nr:TVP38/TMEM64 family protein [Candidatus Loosdrechtia aerotolerans]
MKKSGEYIQELKGKFRRNKKSIIKFAILIAIIGGIFFTFRYTFLSHYVQKDVLLRFFENFREHWWGPPAFILIYSIACVFAIPGSILTLTGGAIFGVLRGSLYNLIAANIGASLAFFMARYLGRDFVSKLVKGRVENYEEKIKGHGFRFIFILRLIPVIPFNGLNIGAGLSGIKYYDYLSGSALGMIPGTVIYTYFADSLLKGVTGSWKKAMTHLIIASVLLILISLSPTIYKRFKRSKDNR